MAGNIVYDLKQEGITNRSQDITNICIGIFFDGTKNNSTNVRLRETYEDSGKKVKMTDVDRQVYEKKGKGDSESSYANACSNVVKLYDVYLKNANTSSYTDKVYVEGIGTLNKEKDDAMDGPGLGRGSHGIRGKVFRACHQLCLLKKFQRSSEAENISVITLDIFGFSRGAAAARNFAYEIIRKDGVAEEITTEIENGEIHPESKAALNPKSEPIDHIKYDDDPSRAPYGMLGYCLERYSKIKIKKIKIKIRYIGLFDTVASYRKGFAINPDFTKDLKSLHLNDGMSTATKVVHLISEDEIRKNFSLSILPKEISENKNHIEISLPGVHSDIGGGYTPKYKESIKLESFTRLLDFYKKMKKKYSVTEYHSIFRAYRLYLIKQLWFSEKEISYSESRMELTSNRTNLSDKYADIPLNFMYELIGGKNQFNEEVFINKYPIKKVSNTYDKLVNILSNDYDIMIFEQLKEILIYQANKLNERKKSLYEAPSFRNILLLTPFESFLSNTLNSYVGNTKKLPYPDGNEIIYYFYKKLKSRALGKKVELNIISYETFLKKYAPTSDIYHTIDFLQKNKTKIIQALIEQFFYGILRNKYFHWSANVNSSVSILGSEHIYPHEPARNMDINDFNRKRSIYNI